MSDINLPPRGDSKQAEKYLQKLIALIEQDKLIVHQTDLTKFDPSAMIEHYRLDLEDYQIEISHNKSESSPESFIMLFNNIKMIEAGYTEKIILAYMHLETRQFEEFKTAAEDQIEKLKRLAEEKRLNEALSPIETVLDNLSNQSTKDDVIEEPITDGEIISEDLEPNTQTVNAAVA